MTKKLTQKQKADWYDKMIENSIEGSHSLEYPEECNHWHKDHSDTGWTCMTCGYIENKEFLLDEEKGEL